MITFVDKGRTSMNIMPKEWFEKNIVDNAARTIRVGDRVEDPFGWKGVVVKIRPHNPNNPIIEHGEIAVWQECRVEYGLDNCEYYTEWNWRENLRILNEGGL